MSGWFSVKRGITDHPIFHKRHDRLYAWIWMLETAAWKSVRQDVGGHIITIKRGDICASQEMIESATGMSRQKLRTFLKALESEGVIKTRPAQKSTKARTIITICNYDKYQSSQPNSNQEPTKDQPIKEQVKQIPPSEGASPADPVKVLFESGRAILMAAGKSQDQAGKILGKWRSEHGVEAVITALGRAQREGAIDPVSFVEGCFRFQQKSKPKWEHGDFRVNLNYNRVEEFMFDHWDTREELDPQKITKHPRYIGEVGRRAV